MEATNLTLSPRDSLKQRSEKQSLQLTAKPNQVGTVLLYGVPIVSLVIEGVERLCLAQISNTLLKQFSYNEIHNRRVALGITCVQCTPVQLEILRRAGAMPVSSRRCGMITRREAERLCKSFLGDNAPPRLPDDFAFAVHHECAWGCRGAFLPARYNSSRAKCIKCAYCGLFFSPNKFIFHSHRVGPGDKYVQPDAANFNSWRRHMKLSGTPPEEVIHAWEDVKAMFNGGTRKRMLSAASYNVHCVVISHEDFIRDLVHNALVQFSLISRHRRLYAHRPSDAEGGSEVKRTAASSPPRARAPVPRLADYVWGARLPLPYAIPWLKPTLWTPGALTALSSVGAVEEPRAFRPVRSLRAESPRASPAASPATPSRSPARTPPPARSPARSDRDSDESVDVETTEDERPDTDLRGTIVVNFLMPFDGYFNPRSLSFVESTTRIRKKCHKFRVRGRTYFSSRVISVDPLPPRQTVVFLVREACEHQTSDHGSSHRRSDEENSSESEKEDHIEVDPAYESVNEDEVSSLTQYPPPGLDVQEVSKSGRMWDCRRGRGGRAVNRISGVAGVAGVHGELSARVLIQFKNFQRKIFPITPTEGSVIAPD
ncbi:SKI family transcriptional corepressor 2 [Eumeta japonica]|uniref:SKI family transcriptional corepressor 2 n=1 Tax=Eumeta variegata TaxID=151549 RepID=A0A4C1XM93_EUMVA|nr:SKI family transcriptional corepressor 2 [Eumeta japonica]